MTLRTTTRTKQTTIATKAETGDLSQKDVALSTPSLDTTLMIKNDAETKAKNQLESFNADLATLLAKYPDVKLVASFDEEVMAQIYTDERRGEAVSVYVPTQSAIQAADEKKRKQEANDQISMSMG